MPKKYPGGFITWSPTEPTSAVASGMWTPEIVTYNKVKGTWPYVSGIPDLSTTTIFLLNSDTSNNVLNARIKNNNELYRTLVPSYGSAPTGYTSSRYKWNGGSCRFDSNQGVYWDYTASGYNTTIGTGDFTMECWAFSDTTFRERTYIALGSLNSTTGISLCTDNSRSLFLHGSSIYITPGLSGSVIVTNTWQHLCAMRKNGVVYTFVNGVKYESSSYNANISDSRVCIGLDISGSHSASNFNGNDWRISNAAIYSTTGFAVPTQKFTN